MMFGGKKCQEYLLVERLILKLCENLRNMIIMKQPGGVEKHVNEKNWD
jgi:hypothetical protein